MNKFLILIAVMCMNIVVFSGPKENIKKEAPKAVALVEVPEPIPARASRSRTRPAVPKPTSSRIRYKASFSALELKIAWCESKNSYTAENPTSTASGRWQFVDGTWNNYRGYRHASDAPAAVQDEYARKYFDKNGYRAWSASRHCWA